MSRDPKPKIGVSGCLLGEAVRYDGTDKRDDLICSGLSSRFELIPVCPEVGAGLGVPRPPVRLVGDPGHILALGLEDPGLDVTRALESFSRAWLCQSRGICGFILKSRSPSCGLRDTPVFDKTGHIRAEGPGIFAGMLMAHDGLLPVEDETGIRDPARGGSFLARVEIYNAWQHLCAADVTPRRLAAFHQRQARLLARLSPRDRRKIGDLLARAGEKPAMEVAECYMEQIMSALKKPRT